MSNTQRRNALSLILVPSPSLSALSDGQPRPPLQVSPSISNQERRPVKSPRQLMYHLPAPPKMQPLLSGSASSDLPLIVFSQTSCGGQRPLSQLSGGRPHSRRSLLLITPDKEKQATEPKRPPPVLFLPTPSGSQKHPRTSHNRSAVKHRARIDVTAAVGWVTSTDDVEQNQVVMPSNRSMRTREGKQVSAKDDAWDKGPRLSPFLDPPQEKQRAMNVRRAKEIHRVFDSKPPHPLLQTTYIVPVSETEGEVAGKFDDRASESTISSASTADLQSPKPIHSLQRKILTSSTLIGSGPPLTSTIPVLPPLDPQEPLLPGLEKTFAHDPLAEFPSLSSATHNPVGNGGEPITTAREEPSEGRREKEFRQRRMRAAKLSKFFGVDYHDLQPHLATRGSRNGVRKVEVAINDRGVLPWDRQKFRSLEMEDVIVRLRDLKSS